MPHSATSATRLIAAERAAKALEMRLQGHTLKQIADALGIKPPSVHKALKLALKKHAAITAEMAPELREQERERLDVLIAKNMPLLDSEDPFVRLKAIDTGTKLSARLSALYGLDGPQKIQAEVTNDVRGELADFVARIAARTGASGDVGEPESGSG